MELNGKVAWVVGASSGIGAAVARELACRGGTVAISARRDEQLREVSGGHMLVVPLDVTDAASAAAAAARVHQELGPIDLRNPKETMRLQKTVVTDKPRDAVFDYLSDFTTTTEWDPGTVVTVNHHGDGGAGTTYLNISTFLGRKTQLTYIVREFIPGERIRLRGENKTVIAVDTMTFRSIDAGTEVTYTAEFTFKGPSRLLAPLLRPAFERLGKQAQTGMRTALDQL